MRTPRQYKVQGSRRSEGADDPPSQTPSYIFPLLSHGVTYVYDGYWWLIVPPGFCIVIVIGAAIFIGEGQRDAVEVRLQRR
jgi:hypothetical protein